MSSSAEAGDAPAAVEGLTDTEVARRVAEGRTNDVPARSGRSVADIVRANVLTRINALLGTLFVLVVATGSPVNGLFGLLIVANSAIGIVTELRAKRTLDALAVVGQVRPVVRRASGTGPRPPAEVVLDDVLELGPGEQIVVDGAVVEASHLEVDESLLTGEADPVVKAVGDAVLSGSFVVAGSGAYRATRVGRDAYAARLTEEAGRFTLVRSELRSGIDTILRIVTWLLVPAGALVVYTQLFTTGAGWREAVLGMVGALVPMVPEGLVLMTSVAFAVGVVRLGRRQCLVQELPAIEGLARVDTVCADKTGTLTEDGMAVAEVRRLPGADAAPVAAALAQLAADDDRPNASMRAVAAAHPDPPGWQAVARAPFTSAAKWSGASYFDTGAGARTWVLGAPDVLLDPAHPAAVTAQELGATGLRVLLLGTSDTAVDAADAPGAVRATALVVLEQRVRPDAAATLGYFAAQRVAVKVISGDNAVAVGAVAAGLGLRGDTLDARALPTDPAALADAVEGHTTFGRVRPEQKRAMVTALRTRGHTVAMTGDGVNDVLALKDADIGVAMGSGSPASRAVAQIVLLDDRFATLPAVVGEGRRVIGNIERVSTLFVTKTVYSVLLALFVGIAGVVSQLAGTAPLPFPFQPIHVTIAAWFTIGVPAFVLSLAPNSERARPGFVRRVITTALPSGAAIAVATFGCYLAVHRGRAAGAAAQLQASTAALVTVLVGALWVLAVVARPWRWWRVGLVVASAGAYVVLFALPAARRTFLLDVGDPRALVVALACGLAAAAAVEGSWWLAGRRRGEPRRVWQRAEAGNTHP